MARRAAGHFIGWFRPLRGAGDPPLQVQLYSAIRAGVLDGRLGPGERLPSSRALGEDLGLSRNTVLGAYDRLVAEGYLVARAASGVFVAADVPADLGQQAVPKAGPTGFSQRGRRLIAAAPAMAVAAGDPGLRPFMVGPALGEFPLESWRRLTNRRMRRPAIGLLASGDPQGLPALRAALADYLTEARGLICSAENVLVVSGAQQALDLVGRVLLDPGDIAVVEDPGYPGVSEALSAVGAKLEPVPVDAQGLDPEHLAQLPGPVKLVAVTPSHQFPLGGTMPLARRLGLLALARQRGCMIVEDDYDCEYRYSGPPLPALQGLDGGGQGGEERVIYVGTFSKVLFPGLRLGYLVLPPRLVAGFVRAKTTADGHAPSLPQAVLADFIADGHLAQHVRRMRKLYRERQQVLLQALQRFCGSALRVGPAEAGLHLVAEFNDGRDDRAVAAAAAAIGISVAPLSRYAIRRQLSGLLFGYAAFPPAELERAAQALGKLLK
jgi:GntR family transcriptional regulator/MocR family aminotransferase